MHDVTGGTYLASQTSFSVFVVLNKTADRSVYGLNSLRKCCCLVSPSSDSNSSELWLGMIAVGYCVAFM